LMRLSLRIMAEREGTSGALRDSLEHPTRVYLSARVTLVLLLAVAAALIHVQVGSPGWRSVGLVFLSLLAFDILCEHFLPWLIVRRDPQRVLEALLPSFAFIVAAVSPLSRLI